MCWDIYHPRDSCCLLYYFEILLLSPSFCLPHTYFSGFFLSRCFAPQTIFIRNFDLEIWNLKHNFFLYFTCFFLKRRRIEKEGERVLHEDDNDTIASSQHWLVNYLYPFLHNDLNFFLSSNFCFMVQICSLWLLISFIREMSSPIRNTHIIMSVYVLKFNQFYGNGAIVSL